MMTGKRQIALIVVLVIVAAALVANIALRVHQARTALVPLSTTEQSDAIQFAADGRELLVVVFECLPSGAASDADLCVEVPKWASPVASMSIGRQNWHLCDDDENCSPLITVADFQ